RREGPASDRGADGGGDLHGALPRRLRPAADLRGVLGVSRRPGEPRVAVPHAASRAEYLAAGEPVHVSSPRRGRDDAGRGDPAHRRALRHDARAPGHGEGRRSLLGGGRPEGQGDVELSGWLVLLLRRRSPSGPDGDGQGAALTGEPGPRARRGWTKV